MSLISELKRWREATAAREGVELYRVLPNAAVDEISRILPKTRDELMSVKGIKEAKFRKYGVAILEIVKKCHPESRPHDSRQRVGQVVEGSHDVLSVAAEIPRQARNDEEEVTADSDDPRSTIENLRSETLSVSQFLDGLNLELSGMAARIRGEVSSVDERERVVYFSLKDAEDGSTLSCLIFRSAYVLSGVRLAVGDEVIVEGVPEIWKPMGKLSMKCGFVEYAGEGALKKAYDALFAKLTAEGLLAPERKREVKPFPTRIALLTSRDGAAIGDFMMNIGRHGYSIGLYASSVEGARAVPELLSGLRYFRKHAAEYDVLVIVRGGGSLESLAAFNNETLVREIAESPIPVIAGIGHEKDVSLAQLVADRAASTPTAAARAVRQSWEEGEAKVRSAEQRLLRTFAERLAVLGQALAESDAFLSGHFRDMKERIRSIERTFLAKREIVLSAIRRADDLIESGGKGLFEGRTDLFSRVAERLSRFEALLRESDPNRALALGYGLIRLSGGKLLRRADDAEVGDMLDIRLSKGGLGSEVKEIF